MLWLKVKFFGTTAYGLTELGNCVLSRCKLFRQHLIFKLLKIFLLFNQWKNSVQVLRKFYQRNSIFFFNLAVFIVKKTSQRMANLFHVIDHTTRVMAALVNKEYKVSLLVLAFPLQALKLFVI